MKSLNKICFAICLVLAMSCSVNNEYFGNKKLGPKYADDYSNIASLSNFKKWGAYNVHDPSCLKADGYYYVYSTDAIWSKERPSKSDSKIKTGNIQIRRSRDLVNWEFVGWVFNEIPNEALENVKKSSGGQLPNGIWAPYILKAENEYRLYYSVSVFGANTSFIGLATADKPEGPWHHKACVVATTKADDMNAIDPTVVTNIDNGQQWMIYGSYFSGIHCVELNPETGLTKKDGDKGQVVARRAEAASRVIEAPEVIYNPELKKYFLFVSYDALFTHYNVRVGRADKPEGPYYDYFGKNMTDTINHYPVLTYAYRFDGHAGWAGVGHCSVIRDNDKYFMLHQGRLAPDNLMMVLHVRQIKWTEDGWPVVSPERYGAMPEITLKPSDLIGKWEKIELHEIADSVKLWQGQIPWGGWRYDTIMFNNSRIIDLKANNEVGGIENSKWTFESNHLKLFTTTDTLSVLVFPEWDWEKRQATIVFTGLNKKGFSIWGKKAINN